VLRYFESAAVHHHADEENDLFPALLKAMADSDTNPIRQLMQQLVAEHRQLEALWRAVRAQLLPVARGETPGLSAQLVQNFERA